MDAVKLKNGAVECVPLVVTTMKSLNTLFDEAPIILFELVELCKNPQHELFGAAGPRLQRLGLVAAHTDGSYDVHPSTKAVVLSAVEIDGSEMTIGNPVSDWERIARPS